jgi:two-component system sensor histidine kinase KdpD
MAAARWAWEKGEPAGHGTGTLPNASWTFRPLQGVRGRAGVAGIEAEALAPGSDERALRRWPCLTRARWPGARRVRRQAVEPRPCAAADRFRSALLNSVSHDLRTPLSTVLGSATTLIDYGKT